MLKERTQRKEAYGFYGHCDDVSRHHRLYFAGLIVYAVIVNAIDKNTNLARAVMNYDFEQTRKILENGADPDERDKYGNMRL